MPAMAALGSGRLGRVMRVIAIDHIQDSDRGERREIRLSGSCSRFRPMR